MSNAARGRIRRIATVGALAATAALGAASLTACEPVPDTYVAIGDSFTAGPLIPNQSLEPLGCLRSDKNYARLAFPKVKAAKFKDVSCSGADTNDVFAAQGVTPGPNPPQLNAVDASTKIVTIGLGGNDIGFSSIVKNCAELNPFASGCKPDYVIGSRDLLAEKIDATAPKIDRVIVEIRKKAPKAAIFVVGYPTVIPASGDGCWPTVPILPSDVRYLRTVQTRLNAMLSARAAANGARYIDLATPSVGHDVCAGDQWVEPIIPETTAAPVHPNAAGMRAFATVVAAKVNEHVKS